MTGRILHGDCREQLATLPDCSIDSIVTDPPYELGFMGKRWDASGIAYDPTVWQECLRVLKPGGHLLAFGGTRTYHRMTVAIEDAGFEIRDSIHWLYGSGFPKSLDVSKAIDKAAGAERPDRIVAVSSKSGSHENPTRDVVEAGQPATAAAAAAAGWGTALKPAHEPIVLARKPLAGTVAANVLEYGTGALNIDACRVGTDGGTRATNFVTKDDGRLVRWDERHPGTRNEIEELGAGRWPANLVLTHSPDCDTECVAGCPVATLNEQSGDRPGGTFPTQRGNGVATGFGPGKPTEGGSRSMGDSGGASRFFTVTTWETELDAPFLYVAKPSRRERNAGLDAVNHHPTVKPTALMRHLVRLVTPPGGLVLDPFLGSGTTAVAATLEGFDWIGCELTPEYIPIIEGRVAHATTIPQQPGLFE